MLSIKQIFVALFFISFIFVLAAEEIYLGYNCETELLASSFDLEKIPDKPKVIAAYTNDDGEQLFVKLHVINSDSDKLTVAWKQPVKLYDSKAIKNQSISSLEQSGENPSPDIKLDSLMINDIPAKLAAYFVNPYITELSLGADGNTYTVNVRFAGSTKPKLYVECEDDGKAIYKSCKIEDYVIDENATLTFNFKFPVIKRGTLTNEKRPYFLLKNKVGLDLKKRDLADAEITEAFALAITDTEVREYDEIYNQLKAIDPANPDTEIGWDSDKKRVKVLTWAGSYFADKKSGDIFEPSPASNVSYFMYVTLYDEAIQYMKDEKFAIDTEENNRMKLAQCLGLQVSDGAMDGKERFLVLWVSPSALFRPAPDPEVDDPISQLSLKYGQVSIANDYITQHYNWMLEHSYNLETDPDNAYPFSGFGYTYNWGNPYSYTLQAKVGLSEFVILPDHNVEVIDNILTADFFEQLSLK